jgi:murein DD-endopeptidase MepM/ murein hydrolase activator NlpD
LQGMLCLFFGASPCGYWAMQVRPTGALRATSVTTTMSRAAATLRSPSSPTNSLRLCICTTMLIGMLFAAGIASSPPEMTPPISGLKVGDLKDTFYEVHNGHRHEAIDILSPRGTPVRAAVSGTIRKLFLSKAGGNTIYEFDEAGVYCYYYAHLDRYQAGLREGMRIERGTIIGFVGSTGNADVRTPHLHFAIFKLGPDRQWWKGTAIDPYPGLVDAVKREK